MQTNETSLRRRPVEWWERRKLEANGCVADDWNALRLCDATDLEAVRNVTFIGAVSVGVVGNGTGTSIENARLESCMVGDYVTIRNIGRFLRNCRIGRGASICDTGSVEFEEESSCGLGTEAGVLDETGSRSVRIYPGLSAQTAVLAARLPKWASRHLSPLVDRHLENIELSNSIGEEAVISGCGTIRNVIIDREVRVAGCGMLCNGMLINNAAPGRCMTHLGQGVNAADFIVEDGTVDSGANIRNCYVGQGVIVERGFSAHDTLMFANCTFENGEACAVLAGPYTVSMHKSSLLIGTQTSFMNAGSGTNQSNHMYKLGPVHWGVLERGVKTSSDSYLMLGAKIGAFSLLMGQHKTHPDSSEFPFSYLFGDDRGATVVVPGVMLRSCGLLRDEKKWPSRDRRLNKRIPLHDRIVFDVLTPVTVDPMLRAYDVIEKLLARPADDDRYVRYRGMKFTRASLERARHLYALGIFKYLSLKINEGFKQAEPTAQPCDWVDLLGLPMRRNDMREAMEAESIPELEACFDKAYQYYPRLEQEWIEARFGAHWRRPAEEIRAKAAEFDCMVEEDRTRYLEDLEAQNTMLAL